jgi:DinB superfamily
MFHDATLLRLRRQLEVVDLLTGGVDPGVLARRPPSGKWSAHQHLAHLARHHDVTLERVRRILAEESPRFERYSAEEDPRWPQWEALSHQEVTAKLRALRAELVELVAAQAPAAAQRPGIHPAMGALPLWQWIEFFLLHEAHHLLAVMQLTRGPR